MSRTKTALKTRAREFDLSRMSEHDLLEVVEIEESCGLSRWGWEAYHAELLRERETIMLVARERVAKTLAGQAAVIGFIAARQNAAELHVNNIAVRQDYRRAGAGGALLEAALKEGARMGARKALLEVRASNLEAQALYARHGFRTEGRRRRYYKEPTEDAVLMRVALQKPGLI